MLSKFLLSIFSVAAVLISFATAKVESSSSITTYYETVTSCDSIPADSTDSTPYDSSTALSIVDSTLLEIISATYHVTHYTSNCGADGNSGSATTTSASTLTSTSSISLSTRTTTVFAE
ncbi:hypothetical protein ACO0QE_002933 [Hanseniaspora vineae]